MTLQLERIALHAARLGLHSLLDVAPRLTEEAAAQNQSYTEFLERVLRSQAEAADLRATEVIMKTASFPFRRSLDDFDFRFQSSVSEKQLRELAGGTFIERKEKFTTCADMIGSLLQAMRLGTYSTRLRTYRSPSLLIIDEIGFLPLRPRGGQALLSGYLASLRTGLDHPHLAQELRQVGGSVLR